ncbi:YqaE/Pmp3 family membrane protein [Sphingomonas solaris]|uniref:YqaE/Pmp3 family membrane protein n=1 Tax=Alterirhizorhabdus solaris TaxID=2529389 RepID=A0A558QXM5_9SPHN|nr:YqaE/Pmp3 family membrane protein [Sphingomonas solaris]TVV71865.1 YqaE/Pmp3 family membrane protein [Sphingomonas solaris]
MANNLPPRERPGAAAIVAALLLPPLGIFLVRGLGLPFWIGVGLTCLGIIPGIVFALLTIFRAPPVETRPKKVTA